MEEREIEYDFVIMHNLRFYHVLRYKAGNVKNEKRLFFKDIERNKFLTAKPILKEFLVKQGFEKEINDNKSNDGFKTTEQLIEIIYKRKIISNLKYQINCNLNNINDIIK